MGDKTQIKCEICNLWVNSSQQYEAHLQGKAHKKRLSSGDGDATQGLKINKSPQGKYASLSSSFVQCTDSDDEVTYKVAEISQNVMMSAGSKRKSAGNYCAVCSLEFNSEQQAAVHFKGSKHAKKLKAVECLNNTSKNEYSISPLPPPPPPPLPVYVAPPVIMGDNSCQKVADGFFCSFCNIHLNSPQQLAQHREGAKHKKLVSSKTTKKLPDVLTEVTSPDSYSCQSCCMTMESREQFDQHLLSDSHWKREEELASREYESELYSFRPPKEKVP